MDGFRFQAESPLTDTPATQRAEESRRSGPGESGGLLPDVTMMETAYPRERSDIRSVARVVLNGTPIGSAFAQPIVRAVQMIIANVVPKQSSQVPFVQRNHMVQQLPSAASDPSFSHSVLPGRCAARALGLQSDGTQGFQNLCVELSIPIQDRVSVGCRVWESFAQLLDDPVRVRVSGRVKMQNPAPCMLDDEQAIQHSEAQGRYGEEIQRHDGFAVISQEG
jgi:hypothetical protein